MTGLGAAAQIKSPQSRTAGRCLGADERLIRLFCGDEQKRGEVLQDQKLAAATAAAFAVFPMLGFGDFIPCFLHCFFEQGERGKRFIKSN